MKKEIKRILLTILALVVCVLLLDFGSGKVFDGLLDKLPSEGERFAKSNFVVTKVHSDFLILGSSRAECNYNSRLIQDVKLGGAVFNCGVDGSLFYFQVAALNSILDRYTPKTIVWDLQIDELAVNKQPENLGLLYPYYWKSDYIRHFLNEQEPDLKYKIWLNAYRYNATGSRILRSLRLPQSDKLGFLAHSSGAGFKIVDFFSIDIKQEPLDDKKVQLLKETVARCKSSGVRLVLIHSPYFNEMKGESSTTRKIKEICEEYEVEFINDSQMPEFVGNHEYIYDALHLNEQGANLFTNMLIKQLENNDN